MAEELTSLRIEEFSDRELLHRIHDLADNDGLVSSEDIVQGLNLQVTRPVACVSTRCSWLRRYGALERVDGRWRMTQDGYALAFGMLSDVHRSSLERLPEDRMLDLMRVVGARYQGSTGVAATLMRREWRYRMAQRP